LNLAFMAMRHLPAYAFVLWHGLEAPLTGLLAGTFLNTAFSSHQQLALLLVLAGGLVGSTPAWIGAGGTWHHNTALGVLVMLVVVGCKATEAAYTEAAQEHSCYAQRQPRRVWLHLAGVLLNGSIYLVQKGSSGPSGHMQPLHWGVVAALSVLGYVGSAGPSTEPR
jgi:hypothetical protein